MIDVRLQTALRDSLRKLAIIGRFSYTSGGQSDTVILSDSGGGDAEVSIEAFFERIKPQLRLFPDSVVTIGHETFNYYRLRSPAEVKDTGIEQPLLADSPLFEEENPQPGDVLAPVPDKDTTYQKHQKRGGRLFRQLTSHLDTVARFTHPNFTRCLLALTRTYVHQSANTEELKNEQKKVDKGKWETLIAEDQRVSAAAIRVLTGYPGDESQHLQEFRTVLTERATAAELDKKRIDALSSALARLKARLSSPASPPNDPVLVDLIKDFAWMKELPTQKAWYPPGTKVDAGEKNSDRTARADFPAFYRTFRRASDSVHRFVRTAALHPFLFAWAASKYKEYSTRDWTQAADEMFQVGVVKQKERVYGESAAERRKNRERVNDLFSNLPAEATKYDKDANYQLLRRLLKESVIGVTLPANAFTRDTLRGILTRLFAEMYGLTSDVGTLARKMDQFTEQFRPIFQAILAAKPDGPDLSLEAFREGVKTWVPPVGYETFLNELLTTVSPGSAQATISRRDMKDAFLRALQVASDRQLISVYGPEQAEITRKDQLAQRAYRHRLKMDVTGDKSGSGLPAVSVTPFVLSEPGEKDNQRADRKSRRLESYREASAEQAGPAKLSVPMSAEASAVLTPGKTYEAVKNGKPVVQLQADNPRSDGVSGQVNLTSEGALSAIDLLGDDVVLTADGQEVKGAGGLTVRIVDLNLRGLEAPSALDPAEADDPLEAIILGIVTKYTDTADTAASTERLRRGLRALVLGEYLLAAPEDAVSLDVADLSQGLGVILGLARHVGRPDASAMEVQNKPDDATSGRIEEINLSTLYPVSSNAEMRTILQYNLDLCDITAGVREYLTELQDLKVLLGSKPALDLVIVNQTLAEHAAADSSDDLVVCAAKPAIIYLTRQAFVTGTTPATAVNALAVRVANAVKEIDLVVPVLVSPVSIGGQPALPVFDASSPLPRLQTGLPGLNPNKTDDTFVTGPTQEFPYLALAASLGGTGDFGSILLPSPPSDVKQPHWKMPDSAKRRWKTQLGLDGGHLSLAPQGLPGRELSLLFRLAWSAFPEPAWVNPLFNLFCLTRLMNLAVMNRRTNPPPGGVLLSTHFAQLVNTALQNPTDRDAAVAGLEKAFTDSLQAGSFNYYNGAIWAPVPNNPGVGPAVPFRVQPARGVWVELKPADWVGRFVALLPPGT